MFSETQVAHYCRKGEIHLIENYNEALASADLWECHHRLELTINGEFAHTHESLIRLKMYYNRPAFELIFLKVSDHKKLHWAGSKPGRRERASVSTTTRWIGDNKRREKLAAINRQKAGDPSFCKKLSAAVSSVMADPSKKSIYINAQKLKVAAYKLYKENGGALKWNVWAHTIYAARGKHEDSN